MVHVSFEYWTEIWGMFMLIRNRGLGHILMNTFKIKINLVIMELKPHG
jgi:hypothetical protein